MKIEIKATHAVYVVSDERGHLGTVFVDTCAWTIPEGQRVTWIGDDGVRHTAASFADAAGALAAARDASADTATDASHVPYLLARNLNDTTTRGEGAMELNHERVRALLDEERTQILFDWIVEAGGDLSLLSDVLQVSRALAEEWLARHTVRWHGSFLMHHAGWAFAMLAISPIDGVCLVATGAEDRGMGEPFRVKIGTEAEARAWLEAQAIAAGFFVER